jgi:hypothetical protein
VLGDASPVRMDYGESVRINRRGFVERGRRR